MSKEIKDLPFAGKLTGAELVHIIKDGNSRVTTLSAVLELSGGVNAPGPAPSFLTPPAIVTDGSPTVGEIVAIDFGSVQFGTIGTVSWINQATGAVVRPVTTGSMALDAPGTFFVRSFVAGRPDIYADSAPVTVAAAVLGAMSAPVLSFEPGRVAGTNPPMIVVDSTDGSIDKTTDSLVIEIARSLAPAAFVVADTITIPLTDILTVDQEIDTVKLEGLAAGAIRFRARFLRPAAGGNPAAQSPDSNVLSDTLGAIGLPAATTTWNVANKSSLITLSNGDRDANGDASVGAMVNVAGTVARSDRRFAEFNVITFGTVAYDKNFRIGIADASVDCTLTYGDPSGCLWFNVNGNDNPQTNYTLDVIWSPDGATPGSMAVYRNGALVTTVSHTKQSGRLVYGAQRDTKIRLNTGQDAFAFEPAGSVRWN